MSERTGWQLPERLRTSTPNDDVKTRISRMAPDIYPAVLSAQTSGVINESSYFDTQLDHTYRGLRTARRCDQKVAHLRRAEQVAGIALDDGHLRRSRRRTGRLLQRQVVEP